MTDAEKDERLGGTFAQCLHFLLFEHGCRPACSPGKRGEPWSRKGFAGKLGVSVRAVGFWLSGERTPDDLASIERVLFGSNEQFDPWKGLLRAAYHRARIGGVTREHPAKLDNGPAPARHDAILHPDIRHVPGFVGREDLLKGIEDTLWQKGGTAALTNDATSAAVKGLGGVGKSVLAREWAWLNRERYRGVWWVRAETEQTLIDDLIDLGSRLIPNLKEVQERDRALHLALDAIAAAGADKPWLIVYDNVEKPGAIRKLKPREHTHILITSRWQDWQDEAQELPVDVFARDVAIDYLLAKRPHETSEAAGRLADALGHLPLALNHARAYCAETNLGFDDYARRLAELIQEAPEDAEYPASVFATFNLAIAKAAEACPEAEKLMAIAAFLAPELIPLDIFTEDVMSEKLREKAVAALFRVSLITHETLEDGSPAFSVHRLTQEVTRNACSVPLEKAANKAVECIIAAVRNNNVADEDGQGPLTRKFLPHLAQVIDYYYAIPMEVIEKKLDYHLANVYLMREILSKRIGALDKEIAASDEKIAALDKEIAALDEEIELQQCRLARSRL